MRWTRRRKSEIAGNLSEPLPREIDGAYVDAGGKVVSDMFKHGGSARILARVDARGKIASTEVESVMPAGFLDADSLPMLTEGTTYAPAYRNGTAVPSTVRIDVKFGPLQ